MAIKKRKLPKKKKPIPPSPHVRKCNRLQAQLCADSDDPIYGAMFEIANLLGLQIDVTATTELLIEGILTRFNSEIRTLQIHEVAQTYRIYLEYTDRTKPIVNGRFPKKYVVTSSHRLALSASLAYVAICKQIGRFV